VSRPAKGPPSQPRVFAAGREGPLPRCEEMRCSSIGKGIGNVSVSAHDKFEKKKKETSGSSLSQPRAYAAGREGPLPRFAESR